MINLFFGISLMLFLCILEVCYIKFKERNPVPWREIIFNLNSGHVFLWVCRGVEVMCFDFVLRNFSFGWVGQWNLVFQWIFVLFAWDFCFYWMHRLHHKFAFLWAVHVVHHEGEYFNLSLGIRNSWYSSLTSFPFFVGLAIIGVSTEQFYLIGALHYFIQFYNHNGVIKNHGFMDKILISPSHHKIHHASNLEYRDKNCGGTFAFWDRWFGTFQTEKEGVKMVLGVPSSKPPSENPLFANNLPVFKYLFRRSFSLSSISKRSKNKSSDFLVSIGGFFLFGLLIFYIYQENKWSFKEEICMFFLLLAATVSIYGLFENYIWGKISWLIFTLILLLFTFYFQFHNLGLILLSSLLLLHCISIFLIPKFNKKY